MFTERYELNHYKPHLLPHHFEQHAVKLSVLYTPDGVNGIFNLHNPPDRNMALGSTQPLTEMSTRSSLCSFGNFPGV